MKYLHFRSKPAIGLVAVIATAVVGVGLMQLVSAAGELKLTPSSGSVQNGSNVNVAVRINPGEPIFGVEAYVKYDQSKLQFVSVTPNAEAFDLQVLQSANNGTVSIARGRLTGIQGDIVVATITFKALASSGSTNLEITGNAVSETVEINPGFVNASITLTAPPASTPPSSGGGSSGGGQRPPSGGGGGGSSGGSSGSQGGGTGGSGSGGSGGQAETKEEKDIGLEVRNKQIGYTKVILKATAKKKVKVHAVYGTDQKQLVVATAPTDFGTEHEIHLNPAIIIPGTKFYYKVIAEDEKGNKTETDVETFKTRGFRIRLLITGLNERPCKRCKITFRSDPVTAETDESGYVTIDDVAPGNHTVEYEQGGRVHAQAVTISGDEPVETKSDGTEVAPPEEIQVAFKSLEFAGTGQSPIALPATIATGLVALTGVGLLLYRRRQNRFNPMGSPTNTNLGSPSQPSPYENTPSTQDDELINKVKGLDRPDPGSIVKPKDDRDER